MGGDDVGSRMPETDSESLIRTVTPITPTETSVGNKLLDAVIGIGAMILLLPLIPFLLALWLWDRLQRDEPENEA
jgi:hypothetical protein